MRITLLQPPYPRDGTPTAASACLAWMTDKLQSLRPGQQDLIVLPEYANAPGLEDRKAMIRFARSEGEAFVQALAMSARRLGSLLAVGTVSEAASRRVNRTLLFDRAGDVAASYDKTHLTDVETGLLGLHPGSQAVVFEHEGVRYGFAVCFDLYFPEYFSTLAACQVDIVICPSYQRSESAERIRLLCRARALDSGAYVVRSTYAMGSSSHGGHSLVASPEGVLSADAGTEACVRTVDIDPGRKFRKPASHGQAPVEHRALMEAHRRPEIYRPRWDRAQEVLSSAFPRLCAHRGLSGACPENTLPAFAAALSVGAHEVEFDLQMSRDGVPVVCHDLQVDRTTDGTGAVTEMDWAEIRTLDAGITRGEIWRGVRVPRLEEVLELIDGRMGLNIHIKDPGPGGQLVRHVCDVLRKEALTDLAYIAGSQPVLRAAADYAPQIPRACLGCQDDALRQIELAGQYDCRRIQFGRQVTREHVRLAHEKGLICNLFWADDPQDARAYVQNGIDVVLTNCAHGLIAAGFACATARRGAS